VDIRGGGEREKKKKQKLQPSNKLSLFVFAETYRLPPFAAARANGKIAGGTAGGRAFDAY